MGVSPDEDMGIGIRQILVNDKDEVLLLTTIGGLCKYMKCLYLNGHRKDRYDGID